jgi:hypothetical protein
MNSQYWKCTTAEQIDKLARYLKMSLSSNGFRVTWEEWKDKRSLNANNLYWQWLTIMAEYFSRGGKKFSKDDMHDLMRHQFLGYEDKVIGSTVIAQQLASTADLDTSQMYHYMSKIDAWSADHGCLLPHPADSEYSTYREAAA